MKKTFTLILTCVMVFLISTVIALCVTFLHETSAFTNNSELYTVRIQVKNGQTIKSVAQELFSKKIIRNPKIFYILARQTPFTLHSGSYAFKSTMNMNQVLDVLRLNKQDLIKVTIAEGLATHKIAATLENNNICSTEDFVASCNNEELLKKYNIPLPDIHGPSLIEGYLFPDTYYFTPFMDSDLVVDSMVSNFFNKTKEYFERAQNTDPKNNNTAFDNNKIRNIVILASIVEREYRQTSEAPIIASVFKNRLRDNIGLYSCATVEYIITEIKGLPHPDIIHYKDLTDESPYNTYKWRGLPPTAISNPGLTALKAVIDAPKTNYYYFRLVDPAKGLHAFSKDFDTHIHEGTTLSTKR